MTLPASAVERVKQPYYDFQIARICRWLVANGYTMHVKLSGSMELRKKVLTAAHSGKPG